MQKLFGHLEVQMQFMEIVLDEGRQLLRFWRWHWQRIADACAQALSSLRPCTAWGYPPCSGSGSGLLGLWSSRRRWHWSSLGAAELGEPRRPSLYQRFEALPGSTSACGLLGITVCLHFPGGGRDSGRREGVGCRSGASRRWGFFEFGERLVAAGLAAAGPFWGPHDI